MLIELFIYI